MQARSIRGWMARAGKAPADAIASADWATLGELARTQVQADLASGKVKPKDAAVIAAIADRNAAKNEPASEPRTDAERYADELIAVMAEEWPGVSPDLPIILVLEARRLQREDRRLAGDTTAAMSHEDDDEDWDPIATLTGLLLTHGPFEAAREWRVAESHQRLLDQLERNREIAAQWSR